MPTWSIFPGQVTNVDWFHPYKHVRYSLGVIYLAILNFPRNLTYYKESMVLVDIIPGPYQPRLTIDSFLKLLVLDMIKLLRGIETTAEGKQILHAAIICNSFNIPPVGRFVGHPACSCCLKSFQQKDSVIKLTIVGMIRTHGHTLIEHQAQGLSWKHAKSLPKRSIEKILDLNSQNFYDAQYF